MKLLRISLSIAIFSAFSTGIIRTEGKPSKASYSAQDQQFIQKAFYTSIALIQQIDQTVEQLAILINKHQIKNLENPDHILRILREDRELLGSLLQTALSAQDPDSQKQFTVVLLQLCEAFLPHIEIGLNNLDKMVPFDISTLAKRKKINIENLTEDDFKHMLETVHNRIEMLKINASKAGLTWYNLLARSFDKHFITKWNKYHGTAIVKNVGGAALLATYLIMKFGKNAENPMIQNIYKNITEDRAHGGFLGLGPLYQINTQGAIVLTGGISKQDDVIAPEQIKLIPWLELTANEIALNHMPLAMLGCTALWGFYTETWKNYISPWVHQKISSGWNSIRGGSYENAETTGLHYLEPKVNFDHMVGLEEVKEEFKTILEYLDNPEKFLRSNTQPETGWILTGPPRTGKSFSFECLCGEIVRMQKRKGVKSDFNFIKIGIEEIAKVGIQTILAYAKDHAPMILFVDEIDLLGLQRVGDNKLLHDFLTALQSTQTDDPSRIVIVMAATNSPETLDKALRQYGRLGKEIRFELPGFKYRKQFLMKELNNMALNPHSFDIDTIVGKTNGKSYEELKAILRKAMTRAWAQGIPLTQRLIEESIDTEINKIIMHDRKELPESETRILASHFAGQAIAMTLLDTLGKLDKVTTKAFMADIQEVTAWHAFGPKDKKDMQQKIVHGALITKYLHDTIDLKTATQIINEAKVLLAGFVAEEILLGSCGMQCHPEDSNKAYSILDQLVFKGIDPSQLSKKAREDLRDKAYALLQQCRTEVKQLLEEHHDALVALTEELVKNSILNDKDVLEIIDSLENKK